MTEGGIIIPDIPLTTSVAARRKKGSCNSPAIAEANKVFPQPEFIFLFCFVLFCFVLFCFVLFCFVME